MTKICSSRQLRQDFLSFFQSRQHTILPSASLLPDAPNLLFTNAGMNPFVPIFLGQSSCPHKPPRVANTQKCIRAGGKHNDLEDVGWDTYHHTFFEMLGNWSFGDYFKKDAIEWSWELITGLWQFPKERIYATIYSPDKSKGDPAELDQEAYDCWAQIMSKAGLDPRVHIINGNKLDNFWMMGETGPCGPCSELHMDLTPRGDSKGMLVNQDRADCIEIWNLVFIQFNANADGTLSPLPSRHVDTGMGLERIASIMQCTNNFTNFICNISNYQSDLFRPLFDALERMSGKHYTSTLPHHRGVQFDAQSQIDIAFRVIADHIRTLVFAIADGIVPGNTDRNYVLKRILRRAVRYGRILGFHKPFLHQFVDVLNHTMGETFPELYHQQDHIKAVLESNEQAFDKTLDRGLKRMDIIIDQHRENLHASQATKDPSYTYNLKENELPGSYVFELYDTYGFPVDLTELILSEKGWTYDKAGYENEMKLQRDRARAAREIERIEVADLRNAGVTSFCGFDCLRAESKIQQLISINKVAGVILDQTPFYATMGGQLGDCGILQFGDRKWQISGTMKVGEAFVHLLKGSAEGLQNGMKITAEVNANRRAAIERHHTATHLFHWALREIVGKETGQKGSYVGPDKLTFDFNSKPLSPKSIDAIEVLINEKILDNQPIHCYEVDHNVIKGRSDVMQFFGDKYARRVRIVQIGGEAGALNGFSMELCGGTHRRSTGEMGFFKVMGEAAISAGIRRVEAISGLVALKQMRIEIALLRRLSSLLKVSQNDLESRLEHILDHQKQLEKERNVLREKDAQTQAKALISKARELPASGNRPAIPLIVANLGTLDGKALGARAESLKASFDGIIVVGGTSGSSVALVAIVPRVFTPYIEAGKIIRTIVPTIGGKGGGRAEFARGGGKDPRSLDKALSKVRELF